LKIYNYVTDELISLFLRGVLTGLRMRLPAFDASWRGHVHGIISGEVISSPSIIEAVRRR
jgi:hypothetical protein